MFTLFSRISFLNCSCYDSGGGGKEEEEEGPGWFNRDARAVEGWKPSNPTSLRNK